MRHGDYKVGKYIWFRLKRYLLIGDGMFNYPVFRKGKYYLIDQDFNEYYNGWYIESLLRTDIDDLRRYGISEEYMEDLIIKWNKCHKEFLKNCNKDEKYRKKYDKKFKDTCNKLKIKLK